MITPEACILLLFMVFCCIVVLYTVLFHKNQMTHLKKAMTKKDDDERIDPAATNKEEAMMLFEATRSIPLSKNFHQSARKIYDILKHYIGATCGYVALLSENREENDLLFLDDGGIPCDVDPSLPMPIRGLRKEAYDSGNAVYSNDFMNSEHLQHMPEGHMELTCVMFAPLLFGGISAGVIGLANKPGGFTRKDVQIAGSFGEIAGLALKHSKIREDLVRQNQFSSSLLKHAPIPILVINPDKTIRFVNRAFETLTGFSSRAVTGISPPYPWWTEDTMKKIKADFSQALKTGAATLEQKFQKKTGEIFFVEITSLPVFTGNALSYYLANWVDITDQKKKEETLLKTQEALQSHARKLETMNTALNVLVEYRSQEKETFEKALIKTFEKLVFPHFIGLNQPKTQEELTAPLSILDRTIKEILLKGDSPAVSFYSQLTPMESQVAFMVKNGKTSKEIAAILRISERTIYFHRENIRKKMGLAARSNLKTHLQSENLQSPDTTCK